MRAFLSRFALIVGLQSCLAFVGVAPALCQGNPTFEQGFSPNRSYQSGQFDAVSTMNGNLSLHIPLVSFPQRGGLSLSFSLNFSSASNWSQTVTRDKNGVAHVSYGLGSYPYAGPRLVEDSRTDVSLNERSGQDTKGNGLFTNIVSVSDAMGGVHPLGYDPGSNYAQLRSTDGSGYLFVPANPQLYEQNATSRIDPVYGVLYNSNGIAQTFGTVGTVNGVALPGISSVADPDGNKISFSLTSLTSGSYLDSVGRSIPAFIYNPTSSTSGCPIISAQYQPLVSSQSWIVPGLNGGPQTYLFCYSSVTWSQDSGNVLLVQTSPALQSVVLPNKTYWAFIYDSMNPSGTGPLSYGDLLQVTTPQGGSISYSYSTPPSGPLAHSFCWGDTNYVHSVTSRSVNSGDGNVFTWQYAYAAPGTDGNSGDFSTTITDPNNNNTVYNYESLVAGGCVNVEKSHLAYSGTSTLLRTVATPSYTSGISSPQGELAPLPWETLVGFYPQTVTTTLDNLQSASTTYSYDSGFTDVQPLCTIYVVGGMSCIGGPQGVIPVGSRTDEKSTDFGGTLLRDTQTTYLWQANSNYKNANLLNELSSVTIFNGSGQQAAQTTYAYDENNGSPQGTFGNQTSKSRWLNTAGTSIKTQTVYNSQGMPVKQIDANLNTTQISYDSTGIFPSQIQYPTTSGVAHIEKFSYDSNTGALNSRTDQNNNLTSYLYDSMLRQTQVTYPDGGQTTNCYTDEGGATCTKKASPPFQLVTTRKMNSTQNMSSTIFFDGFGRKTESLLTSDQQDCAAGDRTDTTYDALGRVFTVSNPYCIAGESTSGLTTFAYDALGRTIQVTHPDNTTTLTNYVGRAIQVQDEGNGTQRVARISQADALGRVTYVCEVSTVTLSVGQNNAPVNCGLDIPGTGVLTGFLTSYQYDALDDLTRVNQGTMPARNFIYDSLSRLTCSSNPENSSVACPATASSTRTPGTVGYTYDSNGNLSNKTDARNIVTTYSYDALNRLTQKSYSDGTPTATFSYDSSGRNPTNPIGRLLQSTTTVNVNGSPCSLYTFNYYDAMGRITLQSQKIPNICGTSQIQVNLSYSYDLAGNLTSSTNYHTLTYGYNNAGRLISVTPSLPVQSGDPSTLFSAAHYNAFGGLISDTLGGNGETESFSYDNRMRRTATTSSYSGATTYSYGLTFAPDGDVIGSTDSVNGNWTYSYDAFNRLVTSSQTSGAAYSYVYDRFGNRWQQNLTAGTGNTSNLLFDNNNHILPSSGVTYDAAGNTTYDGSHYYFYDAENRLIQVDGSANYCSSNTGTAATACYTYDALGRRVQESGVLFDTCDNTGLRDYVYDLSDRWIVRSAANQSPCRYEIYAGDRHLGSQLGHFAFSHTDWIGTERAQIFYASVSNRANDHHMTSLPFGDGLSGTLYEGNYSSTMHFTGKERDYESGLDNFGARYDSSSMGRFMSPDRNNAGAATTNPQSWNGYAYALDNPINNVDPDGLATSLCINNWYGGQNCSYYANDNDFDKAVANSPGVSAQNGKIYATVDGNQVQVGTYIQDRGTIEDDIIAPSIFFGAVSAVRSAVRGGVGILGDLLNVGGRAAGQEAISGLYGTVSREALEAAANSGGQTVRVVTNLTQAPAAGRALSVATGEGAEALTNAAREGGTTYVANIPRALLDQMKNAGLVEGSTTNMGGAVAQELKFAPQAAEFVVKFFRAVQ